MADSGLRGRLEPTADPVSVSTAARRATPDLLRAVLDGVPGMVAYWDCDLRNQLANSAYVEWFGFTPEQMRGMHVRDVLGPDLFASNLPYMQRALAGEKQLFDRTITDVNGHARHTQASYIPDVVDGTVCGFFVMVTEISARVRAETALRQSADEYRALIRSIPGAFVLLFDGDLRYRVAEGEALGAFGFTAQQLEGRTLGEALEPSLAAELAPRYRAALAGHSSTWERRRGSRDYSLTAAAVRDAADEIVAGMVICTDVTDQRRAAATDQTLHAIATAVAANATLDHVCALVVERTHEVFGLATAAVVTYESPLKAAVISISPTLSFVGDTIDFAPDEPSAAAVVARTGQSARVIFDPTATGPAGMAYAAGLRAGAAAPVRVGGELWGAVVVTANHESTIDDDLLERLEGFAELVGLAIANIAMLDELTTNATTDSLTGVANRRSFHEHLARAAAVARRADRPLSVAMIDIDHFKDINDAHGHPIGDRVLTEVAERLSAVTRGHELVARIGGEEFALLLPATNAAGAYRASERARHAIADVPFSDVGHITISLGIGEFTADLTPDALLEVADQALYMAKNTGRNRTVTASP